MKLNRLSDREVDDSKMASVFGQSQHKRSPNSLRLNPLYAGGVKTAKNDGNEDKRRRKSFSGTSNTSQSKKEMNGKKRSKEAEDILSPTPDGAPVISYKDNFKLKDKSAGHGKSANLKQMGRVMPARVKKNTLKTSLQSFEKPKPTVTHKPTRMDVEEAFARARIRRGWRYVIMIILAFLVFCLLITIVLLFATQDSRTT